MRSKTTTQPGVHPPSRRVIVRNRCDSSRIDAQFAPVIGAAIDACLETLPGVVDLRLQGSVARGEAVVGQSDIDFMALLAQAPDDNALTRLQEQARMLQPRFPIVSRIDLDAATLEELSPFQHLALSSDSLSVYGKDTLTRREQRLDRKTLARLVTPDAAAMIRDYRILVEQARDSADEDYMRFCSRIVGKDLLKCLRSLILLGGGEYEVNIERIHGQADDYTPELAALADRLYRLYYAPIANPGLILEALDEAAATLLPALAGA